MARTHFRKEKKCATEPTRELKLEILQQLEKTSARESKKILRSYSSVSVELPRDEIKPLTEDKVLLKFAADKSIEEQITHLKGLLAHAHPDLPLGELFQKLCELGLKEWSPAREPKKSGTFRVTVHKKSKASDHRHIWQRDEESCTNCGSTFALEKDHRRPKALGGSDRPENMRLLCRSCNQRAAIEVFGLEKMDPYLNKASML